MDPALEQLGWTEDQWNRVCTTVTEEAQRTRVGAQILPVVGPEDPSTVAVPAYTLTYNPAVVPVPAPAPPAQRMEISSDPSLYITTISVLVELGGREAADQALSAALTLFRRAANVVARAEDALIFNGRTTGPGAINQTVGLPQIFGVNGIPGTVPNLLGLMDSPTRVLLDAPHDGGEIATKIIQAIGRLDNAGFSGPYACALDQLGFDAVCSPNNNLILARDRILPFLQGGSLVRASTIPRRNSGTPWGTVIALSGNPVELVVATDIKVTYLQTTNATEPRRVFRVSERVALRIKEQGAIAILR